jgi:hypothetical protein
MNQPGGDELLVAARSALLDALDALREHINAVIVVGAQAIYVHTGGAPVALAEATKDCDLALDTRELAPEPLLEDAMRAAGFYLNLESRQPGAWLNPAGIPVDLMVPEALAGGAGRRGARMRTDHLAGPVTEQALALLAELFAAGADAPGSVMAGRAEEGIGDPEIVSAAAAALADDLVGAVS